MNLSEQLNLALTLGWQDLKDSYRRSKLGSFWVTLAMVLQIGTIGVVFTIIFSSTTQDYLPYLATGIIFWTYLTATLNEGSLVFISSSQIIKQLPIPLSVYLLRNAWKNILIFFHNIIIWPFVLILFPTKLGYDALLAIPGFIILTLNLFWITSLVALISTRYRDIPPILNSLLLMAFYLTPVMWSPDLIPPGLAHNLLGLNPLYHYLQLVRLPLLGGTPTVENWAISLFSIFVGALSYFYIFRKYKNRVAYWV